MIRDTPGVCLAVRGRGVIRHAGRGLFRETLSPRAVRLTGASGVWCVWLLLALVARATLSPYCPD